MSQTSQGYKIWICETALLPLVVAAFNRHYEFDEFLVKNSANVNAVMYSAAKKGLTALVGSAASGSERIAKLLWMHAATTEAEGL